MQSPDPQALSLSTKVDPSDLLMKSFGKPCDVGVVGIELATRRRNRMSGRTRPTQDGFAIDVREAFGNCPKCINKRDWWRAPVATPANAVTSAQLSDDQMVRIGAADTLFIGSGRQGQKGAPWPCRQMP